MTLVFNPMVPYRLFVLFGGSSHIVPDITSTNIILKHLVVLSPSYLCVPDAESATCIIVIPCQSILLDIALVQPFYPTR